MKPVLRVAFAALLLICPAALQQWEFNKECMWKPDTCKSLQFVENHCTDGGVLLPWEGSGECILCCLECTVAPAQQDEHEYRCDEGPSTWCYRYQTPCQGLITFYFCEGPDCDTVPIPTSQPCHINIQKCQNGAPPL